MNRMAFSANIPQMRARTKTVTRRDKNTWKKLKPGSQVMAIEKGQGLALGEKHVTLGVITITGIRFEPLGEMTELDAQAEGFETLEDFKTAWKRLNNHKWDKDLTVKVIDYKFEDDE